MYDILCVKGVASVHTNISCIMFGFYAKYTLVCKRHSSKMESTNQDESHQNSTNSGNLNDATSSQSILGTKVIYYRGIGCSLIFSKGQ